ncbi:MULTISPECIES: response regulator transcription factor [unclassified Mesorhizobium]|uniref:response regulator transcription factor n=1 Tax=unclassified Mesorhizobium TaxID=325217 RepID=UPI0003CE281D|nr:transcriptional regulator [Mesorhizobium sp. LSJC280B00]
MIRILIVEDDRRVSDFLRRGLEAEGFHVSVAEDGREGLAIIRTDPFDLVILDRLLPYLDGLELCRIVRLEQRPVLILMLTAKETIQDRVDGLKGGADDYLTKPFAFDELVARIDALRRRRQGAVDRQLLRVSRLNLDRSARRFTDGDREISLTRREFDLLYFLMLNAGKVVSRERILNNVWSYSFEPGTKIVEVYIRYLRAKLGPDASASIQTVRGIGYMLVERKP